MGYEKILQQIQHCIKTSRWEITIHADEEAQEDEITISDIKHVIRTGKIKKKYTHDPRATRYKLLGKLPAGRFLNLIFKFNSLNEPRIITVFLEEF